VGDGSLPPHRNLFVFVFFLSRHSPISLQLASDKIIKEKKERNRIGERKKQRRKEERQKKRREEERKENRERERQS
jgi:hypothetical protein